MPKNELAVIAQQLAIEVLVVQNHVCVNRRGIVFSVLVVGEWTKIVRMSVGKLDIEEVESRTPVKSFNQLLPTRADVRHDEEEVFHALIEHLFDMFSIFSNGLKLTRAQHS